MEIDTCIQTHTHIHTVFPPGHFSSPQLNVTVPLNEQCQTDCIETDDTLNNAGSGFVECFSPPQGVHELRRKGGGHVKIASEPEINDPWTLLDPHDPKDKNQIKPFKKGMAVCVCDVRKGDAKPSVVLSVQEQHTVFRHLSSRQQIERENTFL